MLNKDIARPGPGSNRTGNANDGNGQRPSTGHFSTSAHVTQDLRGASGKVVARIDGDCLKKQVDGSRHFLRKPAGIAFDASILEAAERSGVRVVWVRDRETGDTYTCQLADFGLFAVKVNRGFGPQLALPFAFWRVQRAGAPVQLSLFGMRA